MWGRDCPKRRARSSLARLVRGCSWCFFRTVRDPLKVQSGRRVCRHFGEKTSSVFCKQAGAGTTEAPTDELVLERDNHVLR